MQTPTESENRSAPGLCARTCTQAAAVIQHADARDGRRQSLQQLPARGLHECDNVLGQAAVIECIFGVIAAGGGAHVAAKAQTDDDILAVLALVLN